ncbi:MAG TPA: hypothetical protein VEL47_07915 [Myxococcota bacterium]|nr:hypothetical protein [Myxococcota bacterium]
MKKTIAIHGILIAATALIVGCTKGSGGSKETVVKFSQVAGTPIAQVGKSVLTVESMREDFQRRQGQFKGAANLNTEKARNDYIESQVMQEAMFLDAVKEGYFSKPDVQADVKKLVVQRLMRDKLEKAQADFVPTETDIKDHYDKNQNLYNRDEAVKVAFISIPFGDNKGKAKQMADTIQKEALETVKNANSRAFSRLAMNHAEKVASIGKVSIETNETDYLDKAGFETKFGANSFERVKNLAAIGDFTPVVMSDSAFFVMMKTGARKALNETVETARPKIVKRLAYESRGDHYKKYMESLKKDYNIKVYKEQLAELSKGAEPPKVAESAPKGAEQAANNNAVPAKEAPNPDGGAENH